VRIEPDFRLHAFHEGHQCLKMVDKLDIREPEFWANLLGAIANFSISSISDSVASALIHESMVDQQKRERFREKLNEVLDKKK
jgi:hypothetical protein